MIRFRCSKCARAQKADESLIGRKVACKRCGTSFPVPDVSVQEKDWGTEPPPPHEETEENDLGTVEPEPEPTYEPEPGFTIVAMPPADKPKRRGAHKVIGLIVAMLFVGLVWYGVWFARPANELYDSARGVPRVDAMSLFESDTGRRVVVTGKVKTRTFSGWEGQQLLKGDRVAARMFVELHKQEKAVIYCSFAPTTDKAALPEIETTITIVGTVEKVIDNIAWDISVRGEVRTKGEKHISLTDCKFSR